MGVGSDMSKLVSLGSKSVAWRVVLWVSDSRGGCVTES